jgi:putative membrane protein
MMTLKISIWVSVFFVVLLWSGYQPHDYITWWLEVMPALLALLILALSRKSFPLTALTYWLILIHAIILMVGGHYTYAEVPIGNWFQELSGGSRNNYDKLGHLAQGFIPAIIAREVLIRHEVINKKTWLSFVVISICLAISALYELIEWWVALISDEAGDAFLGTQGYIWDTQSDMFVALIGASVAIFALGKLHDRQLARLGS